MVELTTDPIDTEALLKRVGSPQAGAVVLFLGTTREFTGNRRTSSLDYECYPEMAEAKLRELESEAGARWPLVECAIVHRLGHLPLGEASVAIAVSSAHRKAAFEAGQWLIDTLKEVVPIWKKENWADGKFRMGASRITNSHTTVRRMTSNAGKLLDAFGRVHTNLRVSVTDRCNIRCFYCMPNENVRFKPREEILTFEEIERFVGVVARLGVNRLRITGGEPLVRADLPTLIAKLSEIAGIEDIALTTNGMLLAEQAADLKAAGLHRLNISLDGLSEETFRRIARREGLAKVLEGISAAQRLGFRKLRLNAVAIRGITEDEIVPLGTFAREHDLEMRFIEFMPLDAEDHWEAGGVFSGDEIRRQLESAFGPLLAVDRPDPSQPAVDYAFADGVGRIGFINPVSQPFCHDCNRLRITAEGKLRNCLFSTEEWDARAIMRGSGSDRELAELVQSCVAAKRPGHGIDSPDFMKPERAMYQIGG